MCCFLRAFSPRRVSWTGAEQDDGGESDEEAPLVGGGGTWRSVQEAPVAPYKEETSMGKGQARTAENADPK